MNGYPQIKWIMDRILSFFGFLIISPVFVVLCFFNLWFLGRPIFFKQKRIGIREKPFFMFKFRSMRMIKSLGEKEEIEDEKRLTPYGAFIRKWSLDEFPSLINVMKGEMSFVGPRPLLPEYLPIYTPYQHRRHQVKPGITGLVQIKGRNSLIWKNKFRYDVWYVSHCSFKADIYILWKTFFVLIHRKGISHKNCATMPKLTKK